MDSLTDHEGDLETALGRISATASYADVLVEKEQGRGMRIEKDVVQPSFLPVLRGAIFRAWTGERWSEAVARSLAPADLKSAADGLLADLARAPASRQLPPGADPKGHLEGRTHAVRPVGSVSPEELLELVKGWHSLAMEQPNVLNSFAQANSLENERLFLSSSGARRFQSITRVFASVFLLARENGRVEYDATYHGGTGGFEIYDRIKPDDIRASARIAHTLLSAKEAPKGPMNVLLDPSTSGTFAHESFGHGTEADQLLRERSYLKPLLGETLAPDFLTLVDDGSRPGGFGQIFFDDEGTPAQRTVIIDHGKFVEVLHDRETAAALHRKPTGNARRADFLSRSFVRMTNTLVEPSDWTLPELLKEAKEGVLLEQCTSGIEDPLGGQMQIKVKRGRRIEHGELTDWYSGMALSGKVLEVLRSIRGVGVADDFEIHPGSCGKGHTDLLPVGSGGPYLLAQAIVGPA
jgi:TldD protein